MFEWSAEKDAKLLMERGIGFHDVILSIERGNVLAVADHPNQTKYPNQKIFYIQILNYVYMVPFIQLGDRQFLKTIIPSRKATKRFLKGQKNGSR